MQNNGTILLVCFSTVFGGAEVRVLQTARALLSGGLSYRVAVLSGSPLHEALIAEGLAAEPIGIGRADPRILPGLVQLANRIGASCIDSHNMQSQYWASFAGLLMPSRRRIMTVHSVYRECYPNPPKLQIHEGALRLGRRLGAEFIAVSEAVAEDLKRLCVPESSINLNENGIQPLPYTPAPSDVFKMLGWGPDAFVIAVVGRLEPVKGHSYLFEAVARLAENDRSRVRVLVIGDGRERRSLETKVAELGITAHVHFTGFRKDVPALFARTDLLCMPSLTEGLPYAALEAGRQNVPLLLSKVGGPARIFTEGETAAFVPPADPEALKRAIAMLLAAPAYRARLGEAARELVETRFSVDRMIAKLFALYRAGPEMS